MIRNVQTKSVTRLDGSCDTLNASLQIQLTHDGAHSGTYHLYLDTFQYVYRDLIGTRIQGPYRDLLDYTDARRFSYTYLLDYTDARRLPIYIFRNNSLYLYT